MSKVLIASMSMLVVLVFDSLASQSAVLSVFDAAGIYLLLVWFNLSQKSEEGAWGICLVISLIFGLFRQQNMAQLILGLTLALICTNFLLQILGRNFDYYVTTILGFFCISLVLSVLSGLGPDPLRSILFLVLNTAITFLIQLLITRRTERSATGGYKYR